MEEDKEEGWRRTDEHLLVVAQSMRSLLCDSPKVMKSPRTGRHIS